MKCLLKTTVLFLLRILFVFFLFALTINVYVQHFYEPFIYKNSAQVPAAQTALVLGASVRANGKPSPFLTERLERAIELYRTHKVSKLLFSGDHSDVYYDEVNAMKNYAMKYNIRDADIFLDHSGLRTLDSVVRTKKIFGVADVIIVTQGFHLSRALWIADAFSLSAYGFNADTSERPLHWQNYLREFAARTVTFFELYIFKTMPRYMGKEIPISGDGRLTWDKTE